MAVELKEKDEAAPLKTPKNPGIGKNQGEEEKRSCA